MGPRSLIVTLTALSLTYAGSGIVNNDKDQANSYLWATTYQTSNPSNLPPSLMPLTQGASPTKGSGCLFPQVHDVVSCIQQGDLPDGWDARSASQSGATIVMNITSGTVPNTGIMSETLTYLYNQDGSYWTAIRNGSGAQPLNGIVTWDGVNAVASCKFAGKYAIHYAFDGQWGQNLDDLLAKKYPQLFYVHDDAWGYCLGTGEMSSREPVIVIPVTEQQSYGRRTTLRSAGVLIITGSPSGRPVIEHRQVVKPGDLPGPAYPVTLVAKQRDMMEWSAGRVDKARLSFGYEPSTVASQVGNDSEYLLRARTADPKDPRNGRLFWVTPLTPKGSSSQVLVAYSITPADEATTGSLNQQSVYVLADDDPRLVNMDDMLQRVENSIKEDHPGFFTGTPAEAGTVSEFLPVGGQMWQAFAEQGGRVVFRVDVSADARIKPTVVQLDSVAGDRVSSPCAMSPGSLNKQQLANCMTQFANELANRS